MKVLRYTGILIGLTVVVGILLWILEAFLGSSVGMAASVAPLIGAAAFEGEFFYKKERRIPEKTEKRAFARMATLVNLVIGAIGYVGLMTVLPELRTSTAMIATAVASVILLLLVYFVSGFFFGQVAKNKIKVEEKKRAKAAA